MRHILLIEPVYCRSQIKHLQTGKIHAIRIFQCRLPSILIWITEFSDNSLLSYVPLIIPNLLNFYNFPHQPFPPPRPLYFYHSAWTLSCRNNHRIIDYPVSTTNSANYDSPLAPAKQKKNPHEHSMYTERNNAFNEHVVNPAAGKRPLPQNNPSTFRRCVYIPRCSIAKNISPVPP